MKVMATGGILLGSYCEEAKELTMGAEDTCVGPKCSGGGASDWVLNTHNDFTQDPADLMQPAPT